MPPVAHRIGGSDVIFLTYTPVCVYIWGGTKAAWTSIGLCSINAIIQINIEQISPEYLDSSKEERVCYILYVAVKYL